MSLRTTLRGFRATTTFVVTAAVAFSPAVAQAATKKHAPAKTPRSALKEAHGKAPAKSTVKLVGKSQAPATPAPATAANGLGNKMGLAPAMQLTAMRTAIAASPAVWVGHETGCNIVTPMLTSQPGLIMAGNFRDADANCYVWMNMEQSAQLTGSEICKTVLHEMGHLNGLQHSTDPTSIMFSPFQSDPIPTECQPPAARASVSAVKATTSAATQICPFGTTNPDYCQSVPAKKKPAAKTKHSR